MNAWTQKLERRLKVFLDAGLLKRVPTRWQTLQAELEMAPYVLSADATAEPAYRGAPLGHALVRQPFIMSQVGPDHLRVGTGLGAHHRSLATHLAFTHHQGMPVFD
ncbi:MAG: hypothetical protein KC466_11565, partial [Myxococcales bacterium]|nr:hypothetical protein [Myxococcales bacterium]